VAQTVYVMLCYETQSSVPYISTKTGIICLEVRNF